LAPVQLLLVVVQPQVVLQQGVLPLEAELQVELLQVEQVLQVLVLLEELQRVLVGQPPLLLAVCWGQGFR
jgi:hypothetical protein